MRPAVLANTKLITQLFINGKFVNSKSGKTFDLINPSTEEKICSVQDAHVADVEDAVVAARTAFDKGPWGRMDPGARAKCLFKLADLVEKHQEELAALESLNNGKPFEIAKKADLPLVIQCYRYFAGYVDKIHSNVFPIDGPFFAYNLKEPVGVAAQIIPWNFPLLMQAWKFAPALAAGCTIVMKTSPNTPLTAYKVAELTNEAGFPPGVINVVTGHAEAGSYLSTHPKIDKVAFTGSTKVGLDIMRSCHVHNLKRVTLELGGKSPNIITAHADLDKAVHQSAMGVFFNTGQCCIAATRTYVHASVYDKYIEKLVEVVKCNHVGDGFDPKTSIGPIVNRDQFNKVMSYIESGKKEGARLVYGGKRVGNKGFFVEPTIFADVKDDMTIAREEIFGPVMSIFKYHNNEEVIDRMNNSRYGLGAGVMTENASEGLEFSRKIRAGTVYVNCYNVFGAQTPFGGYKDSGVGRELGEIALSSYLELKTVIQHRGY